jgi:hypothetical protein
MSPITLPPGRGIFGRADLLRILAIPSEEIREGALAAIAVRKPNYLSPLQSTHHDAPPRVHFSSPNDSESRLAQYEVSPPKTFVAARYFQQIEPAIIPEAITPTTDILPTGTLELLPQPHSVPLLGRAATSVAIRKAALIDKLTAELDLDRFTEILSKRESFRDLPRCRRSTLCAELSFIRDRARRLTPYWEDQDRTVELLMKQHPRDSLFFLTVTDQCLDLSLLGRDSRTNRRLPAGTPVIAWTDLGALAREEPLVEFWLQAGRTLLDLGHPAIAFVPTRIANIPKDLHKYWTIVPWGIGPVDSTDSERAYAEFRTLISPAVRLDPGLLRALRTLLPSGRKSRDHPLAELRRGDAHAFISRSGTKQLRRAS